MTDSWAESWDDFFQLIGTMLRSGATPDELANRFGDTVIKWTGVLDEKHLEGLAPTVGIQVPQTKIELEGGRTAEFAGLSLPASNQSISDWDRLEIGNTVTFTARLVGAAPFPPVELQTLRSGRVILGIRLTEGVPLS